MKNYEYDYGKYSQHYTPDSHIKYTLADKVLSYIYVFAIGFLTALIFVGK